ncbi:MAG: phosphoglycerate dehydrogenase [Firmicutes bacterium]|nr:phosphoglycerate dehydrogenase [Bacillota bacterium]
MKVYLNDPIDPAARQRLLERVELTDSFAHPEELDAIIVRQQYCPAEVIRRAKKCRLIQQHGVGLDRIDVAAARECGIPVRNTAGSNARTVAEYTMALLLDVARKVSCIQRQTRAGLLTSFGRPETVGTELCGKRLGLVGCGHIAGEVRQIAREGFRMEVCCCSPFDPPEVVAASGMTPVKSVGELLASCDAVSLHCLLSEQSYHIIDTAALRQARPGLILINTARGGLIDEQALYQALTEGRLAGAGLDVFEHQPPDPSDPLLGLDNVVATMHVAGSSREALARTGRQVVDAVFAALGISG